jgi:hypothetical protein
VRTGAAPALIRLPPNFSIAATPTAQTVTAGNATNYSISMQAIRGFSDPVSLSVDLPDGTLGTFNPNPAATSSTLTVTTTRATPASFDLLRITGTAGLSTHTAYVTLTVTPPPDFSLSAAPASQTVSAGNGTSYTTSVQPSYGFADLVSFSVSGLPASSVGTFMPNPTGMTSTLSVATSRTTPTGAYTLTVTGTSGPLTHSTSVTLVVGAADTCGAPANPWGYNFCLGGGNVITAPPSNFCSYFPCIPSFWIYTNGYVEECQDGMYSHSGGQPGSCSYHGGNWRALLSP